METLREVKSIGIVSTDDTGLLWYVAEKLSYKPNLGFFAPMFVLRMWLDLQPDSQYKQKLVSIFEDNEVYCFSSILLCDVSRYGVTK